VGSDQHFSIHVAEAAGAGPVVVVAGEIDLAAVDQLEGALDRAGAGGRRLVVDLSGVRFIDSSGLHLLVRAFVRRREAGGEAVLRDPSPTVVRLLAMTGVAGVLPVEGGRDPG
jgi:anti-anti-sigma factor